MKTEYGGVREFAGTYRLAPITATECVRCVLDHLDFISVTSVSDRLHITTGTAEVDRHNKLWEFAVFAAKFKFVLQFLGAHVTGA